MGITCRRLKKVDLLSGSEFKWLNRVGLTSQLVLAVVVSLVDNQKTLNSNIVKFKKNCLHLLSLQRTLLVEMESE